MTVPFLSSIVTVSFDSFIKNLVVSPTALGRLCRSCTSSARARNVARNAAQRSALADTILAHLTSFIFKDGVGCEWWRR
jgi:hypothetical protein